MIRQEERRNKQDRIVRKEFSLGYSEITSDIYKKKFAGLLNTTIDSEKSYQIK